MGQLANPNENIICSQIKYAGLGASSDYFAIMSACAKDYSNVSHTLGIVP